MIRIVFMGTPEFAVPCLNMLVAEGYDVAAVVTQPDRPKGRGGKSASPPVKTAAAALGIPVFQPEKPGLIYGELAKLSADIFVTAAYGCILKKDILALPRLGTVNVHASLLPKYRGASPIHQALLNGDSATGVTTMLTDEGIDTGDILLSDSVDIAPDMYFIDLHDKLSVLGADVLKRTLPKLISGELVPTRQDSTMASRAPIIKKDAGMLDFADSASKLVNTVRAYGDSPGAYAVIGGKRVRVFAASADAAYTDTYTYTDTDTDTDTDTGAAGLFGDDYTGTVTRVDKTALGILCGDRSQFLITRLQFDNGRKMDMSECWHNLRGMKKVTRGPKGSS